MLKLTPILLTLSLLLALSGSVYGLYPLFDSPVNYGDGSNPYPYSVFLADLDGDNDNDVATANYFSGNVSIMLNNGDGTFQPAVTYGAGSRPTSVFLADLDGDNDNDLAVANEWSDNVSILLNDGDGAFAPAVNYATADRPLSIFAADLDGDNDNDLVVGNHDSDDVSILLNNGDATFAAAVNYGVVDGPHSVFLTDLDGDNDIDLAVPNGGSDNVSILLNNGDGTFTAGLNYGVGDDPLSVFVADLDGDNDNDLVVANFDSDNVSILLNNGDGTFAAAVNYGTNDGPNSVFSADFDGDNDSDVAVSNYWSDNISILLNNGDGTFATAANYGAGDGPHSVFSADLDGDNDNDLSLGNEGSNNVSILFNLTPKPVCLDIKPGSCPNPLNLTPYHHLELVENVYNSYSPTAKVRPDGPVVGKAVLPVAIVGTNDFNVMTIDPEAVQLEGVSPLRSVVSDVSTPVSTDAGECECNTLGPDGISDLALKFNKAAIIEALGEVSDGNTIQLTLTGELYDGTPIEGNDCVVIRKHGSAGGQSEDNSEITSGRPGNDRLPSEFTLSQNYPNPFNPVTEISFSLPMASDVTLEVFNMAGQRVATLAEGRFEAGNYAFMWDGSDAASGIYLYRLKAGEFVETKKMVLLK